jgi:hypothetical protein
MMAGKKKIVAKFPESDEKAKAMAHLTLRASANAAAVMDKYTSNIFGEIDIGALIDELATDIKQVKGGDMGKAEAMLMGQAEALQAIFVSFARRAQVQEYQSNLESFFRMALKAQSQCRMTLETLAAIKNPPIVYARQANVTTGPQQINNGTATPSRTREIETEQTQLSGGTHELLPDTRASGNASRVNPALETLGEIDRAEIRRG